VGYSSGAWSHGLPRNPSVTWETSRA
jgi:hypothetical protein